MSTSEQGGSFMVLDECASSAQDDEVIKTVYGEGTTCATSSEALDERPTCPGSFSSPLISHFFLLVDILMRISVICF
jgi:hypothetical protein